MRRWMRSLSLSVLALALFALGVPSATAAQRKLSVAYDETNTTAYGGVAEAGTGGSIWR